MSQQVEKSDDVLYEDKAVRVTQKSVRVLRFYFPQDSKDEIPFKDIKRLALKYMDEMDQILGVDPEYFKDLSKRVEQNTNSYLEMAIQDQSVRLSFAPEQPLKVLKLIEKKLEETKMQGQKESDKSLQQNTLYANVQVTAQKIQNAIDQLKKSEGETNQQKQNQKLKRDPQSPSRKLAQQAETESPRKKIKQSQKQGQKDQSVQIENR